MAEQPTSTGYEPKHLAEIEDSTDIQDHTEVRVKPMFFHDTAEGIMTASQELDPDDEQIRALLDSPYINRSEKQVQSDLKFITLNEKS